MTLKRRDYHRRCVLCNDLYGPNWYPGHYETIAELVAEAVTNRWSANGFDLTCPKHPVATPVAELPVQIEAELARVVDELNASGIVPAGYQVYFCRDELIPGA